MPAYREGSISEVLGSTLANYWQAECLRHVLNRNHRRHVRTLSQVR